MKNKLTISIVAILATGSLAFAQPFLKGDCPMQQQHRMCAHSKMNHMNIFEKLNLSDAQKSAMEQNRKAHNMKFRNHNRVKMSNYLSIHGFDKARFIKDRTQMAHDRAAYMADAFSKQYAILTPVQKKEFIQLQKDREIMMPAKMAGQGSRDGNCSFKRGQNRL
jgi:Spy/CpxP family protein refolding chaperone